MAKPKTPPKQSKNPPKPDDDEEETPGEGDEEEDDDEDDDRKINAIVTNRVNRALKPLTKQIADLTAALAAKAKPESDDEDDDDEEETPRSSKKGKSGVPDKKLTALEKRVKDAEERAANAEKAQQEQAAKAKIQEENAVIGAALQKAGITDPKVVKAITLSLREDELIVRDEETGKPRFKTVDKYGSEDLVDPEVGIGKWIKTDGKAFVPAVQASGSGAGGTGLQQTNGTKMSKAEISRLDAKQRAAIELERASRGQPPLGED